jgi:F420-dependent oxidoreductase-like protein
MTDLRWGAFVPQGWRLELSDVPDPQEKFRVMVRSAREAERTGYDSLWVFDHFHTAPRMELETTFEAWSTMAALARETSRIRLGQMVTCNGYRPPALLAKMSSCIDVMSGGRLIVGIGAGWYQAEFEAYGYEFPDTPVRLRMLGEAVQVLKAMWTEDRASFQGSFYTLREAINEPKPVQRPHPPLWIGGGGEKVTLRLVARFADGCNIGGEPEVLSHKLDVLRRHCEREGRDYDDILKTTNLWPIVGDEKEVDRVVRWFSRVSGTPEESVRNPYVGPPELVAERIQRLVDLGFRYFCVFIPNCAEEGAIQGFAEEVIPLLG